MKSEKEIVEKINELIKIQDNAYKYQNTLGLSKANNIVKETVFMIDILVWVLGKEGD